MIINKILNNNVVVVKDKHHKEKIVMGRGIGFKKRVGDSFDESKVDKVFVLSDEEISSKFQELIRDIPEDYIKFGCEIIEYAKSKLGKCINDSIYVSLIDHIYTATTRYLDGIPIKNMMLYDVRRFYQNEFDVAMEMLNIINERFNIELPIDEAGFIALHIVNSSINEDSIENVYQITKIIQSILSVVRHVFHIEFDQDNVYYHRFITHLKFFAHRMINKGTYNNENIDDLLNIVRNKYMNSYNCTEKVSIFLDKEYNYRLSDEEKLYLTIHIEKLIYKTNA